MTWKRQVEEESMKIGLRREDTLCRSKWSVGVNQIAAGLRRIWSPSLVGVNLVTLTCWSESGHPHLLE